MLAVVDEDVAVVADAVAGGGEAEPAVEVFAGAKGVVELKLLEDVGAGKDGDEDVAAAGEEGGGGGLADGGADRHVVLAGVDGVAKEEGVAVDDVEFGMGGEVGDLALEVVGLPEVVAVEERDEIAGGGAEAGVAGAGEAAVFLDEVDDAVCGIGEEGGECGFEGGGVGRAVVDDEDFVGWDGLGEGGAEGFGQVLGDVVGGDDDADARGGGVGDRGEGGCGGVGGAHAAASPLPWDSPVAATVLVWGAMTGSTIPSSGKGDTTALRTAADAAGVTRADGAVLRPRLCLLYHELVAEGSAYAYAMTTAEFARQVGLVRRLQTGDGAGLMPELTFDDGHVSNLSEALPVLERAGVRARFFITAGWTGARAEYMDWPALRELATAGHEIGAHGMTHTLLTHCDAAGLERELGGARKVLEDGLGQAVTTMSLPGGRYDGRVMEGCRAAGYQLVFTSEPRVWVPAASSGVGPERVGRLNIRGDATVAWIERLLDPATGMLARLECVDRVKGAAKRVLGDALYRRLWSVVNRADGSEADATEMPGSAGR